MISMIPPTPGFDYRPQARLVFGPGTIDRLGEFVGEWNAQRALIVTDAHIVQAGHVARATHALQAAGIQSIVYAGTRENPTTEDVDACLAVARDAAIDTIIGLGGGSSMDTAKGCNFILTNGGSMHDYWGVGKATRPMLPFVAVPTTAGTGSECQSFALIADARSHNKMACGDRKALARVAILDPVLTVTQPRQVTADTGIDALTHAAETAVTSKRNPLSLLFSREAFRLIIANLERVLNEPQDVEARGQMLLAAAYAGTAIENSMLGAAHSCANPLTAHFNVVHGRAVGMMLPAVVRFNAEDAAARRLYAELARHAGLIGPDADEDDAVAAIVQRVERLLDAAGVPRTLAELNIPRSAIGQLAQDAATQWTANFNPRPVSADDFEALYQSAYAEPDRLASAAAGG